MGGAGRDKATVEAFFDPLGEKRAKRLKLVSCDMAGWIEAVLADRCPRRPSVAWT